jgi:hypothetical protein
MSNVLGNYNPSFFANEALIQLFKALGMAGRVHRGAEAERNSTGNKLGDVINLKRPSHFTAQSHVAGTGTTAQDIVGQNVAINLNSHEEVKFQVSDVEIAYSSERIINDHIKPAAYALADKIDQDLHALGATVGPKSDQTGTVDAGYITGPRKTLRNNNVPMDDNIHYLIDSGMEAAFLDLGIFHEARITGDGNNTQALMNGSLGKRFGVEVFASQNADVDVSAMTSTVTKNDESGDAVGAVNLIAGYAANDTTTMLVDTLSLVETLQIGDTFTLAGDTTTYILTANTTLSSGAGSITFFPALRTNVVDDQVITFDFLDATQEAAHVRNLMFHKNAFALAFAPLPKTGDGRGAEIATVTDEISGLSVRARMWYDGGTATNLIAFDALYGAAVLDGQLATRVNRVATIAPV